MDDHSARIPTEAAGPATVAHVVDAYRCYPGEVVTFYTCVAAREAMSNLALRIALPDGMALENAYAPSALPGATPYVEIAGGGHVLAWTVDVSAGQRYEFRAQARVAPTPHDKALTSRAVITHGNENLSAESVTFVVRAKGSYLQFLPELYADDELMGRFLMLFESFWAPIERQIDSIDTYFDPQMTPPGFLRWLASWFDLTLSERLPEERRRQLVQAAVSLYRRRGTKQGLKHYLEIFTGGEAHIIEHRAENFRLGAAGVLGHGIALGQHNRPHTFTVRLRLPPMDADEDATDARADIWIESIRALIEAEKPAHTAYTLHIESLT